MWRHYRAYTPLWRRPNIKGSNWAMTILTSEHIYFVINFPTQSLPWQFFEKFSFCSILILYDFSQLDVTILFDIVLRFFIRSLILVRIWSEIWLLGQLRRCLRKLKAGSILASPETVIYLIVSFIRVFWPIYFIFITFLRWFLHSTMFIYHHFLPLQELLSLFEVRCITSDLRIPPFLYISSARINGQFTTLLFIWHQIHIVVIRGCWTHVFNRASALRVWKRPLALLGCHWVILLVLFTQSWNLTY